MTYDIEDIAELHVDMNLDMSIQLSCERSKQAIYQIEHEKIKFVSTSGHVIFCLLYTNEPMKYQENNLSKKPANDTQCER